MSEGEREELLNAARAVRMNAHAPYSRFQVGAAVRGVSGRIHLGVNVENSSYPTGLCAERAAIAAAITAGETELVAVAVVTDMEHPAAPCGMCRQALAEFGSSMDVHLGGADPSAPVRSESLSDLLPQFFDGRQFKTGK